MYTGRGHQNAQEKLMTICVVCKGELDDDIKVYLDGYYIRKHNIKVGRARFLHSRYPLDFAHPACVEHPGDLSEKAYREWAAFTLAKQAGEIQDLRRALERIEHALLDSPEDVPAALRDELEHERRNHTDGRTTG